MAKTADRQQLQPANRGQICEEIGTTDNSLMGICARDGMPSQSMVYRWLEAHARITAETVRHGGKRAYGMK